MIGIIDRLKQSKISKICVFILSLVVGLSSFLLLSPTAYAESSLPSREQLTGIAATFHDASLGIGGTNQIAYVDGLYISSGGSIYYSEVKDYVDVYIGIHDWVGEFDSIPYQNYSVWGQQRLVKNFEIDFTVSSTVSSSALPTITKVESLGYELDGEYGDVVLFQDLSSVTYSHTTVSTTNDSVHYKFDRNVLVDFVDYTPQHNWFILKSKLKLRVYFEQNSAANWKQLNLSGQLQVTENNRLNNKILYRLHTDKYYLYNIYKELSNSGGDIYDAIEAAASQAHSDSAAEKAAINSAASQAHSDSQTINNNILHDSSGSSQNSASVQASYEDANQAADQAIDSAVHNYDTQLDQVENVNFDNFFTSQNMAVTFWRDVGEFVLDSSNLGYIASGMIIVTLIGLFVFLLRL